MTYGQILARYFSFPLVAFCIVATVVSVSESDARVRGGVASGVAPPANNCANGDADVWQYDLCQDAPETGYKNTNLLVDYVREFNGNAATIHHDTSNYNAAGFAFPVANSCEKTSSCLDPAVMSYQGAASVSGFTITWTTNSKGGSPKPGMYVWQAPSTGQANLADGPRIVSCTGSSPTFVCQMDKNEGTKGSSTYNASYARGCVWQSTGGFSNAALAGWYCDFRGAAGDPAGVVADFSGPNGEGSMWGAVGGHNSTNLRVSNGGSNPYTIKCWRCNFVIDAEMDGRGFMTTVGGRGSLDIRYSNMDGGNDAVPVGAPASSFPFQESTAVFNWAGACGTNFDTDPITINVRFNYVHGFAGNPLAPSHCNAIAYIAANVFERNGENNGDTPVPYPDATGLHGSVLGQWQNTTWNPKARIHIWNNTIGMRYGYRDSVVTAAAAILSGHGTAHVIDHLDINYNTIMVNISSGNAGTAPATFHPFQMGAVNKITATGNRINTIGVGNCFSIGTDLAFDVGTSWSIASTADAPNNRSTLTTAGFVDGTSSWYPGQFLNEGRASQAIRFTASSVSNGNGTSNLTISSHDFGSSSAMAAGTQIWTLRGPDPIIVISGGGDNYVVTGEHNVAAGSLWRIGWQILPYGTDGTTTNNATVSGQNGTARISGLLTRSASRMSSIMKPGNFATIDDDFVDNYAMQVEGEAGVVKYDRCPGATAVN